MRVTRIIGLLLALFSASAAAIDYQIEVVIFANKDPEAFHAEQWALDSGTLPLDEALDLFSGESRPGFRVLGARDLEETSRLLEKSERFEVLKHVAWQQPRLEAAQAVAVRIHGGTDYAAQYPDRMAPRLEVGESGEIVEIPGPDRLEALDGTIRVELGRFLHVHTDLVLRKPVIVERIDPETQTPAQTPSLLDVRMQEHRRMRSRELHYIDHPLLGVLVQITPVEEPAQ